MGAGCWGRRGCKQSSRIPYGQRLCIRELMFVFYYGDGTSEVGPSTMTEGCGGTNGLRPLWKWLCKNKEL